MADITPLNVAKPNTTNNYLVLTTMSTEVSNTHPANTVTPATIQQCHTLHSDKNIKTTTTTTLAKTNTPHQHFKLFSNLSKDIGLQIFKHLSPVESACLGLTCTSLYNLHMATTGVVDLGELGWVEIDAKWKKQDLSCILKGWMGEQGFIYMESWCLFVSKNAGEEGGEGERFFLAEEGIASRRENRL